MVTPDDMTKLAGHDAQPHVASAKFKRCSVRGYVGLESYNRTSLINFETIGLYRYYPISYRREVGGVYAEPCRCFRVGFQRPSGALVIRSKRGVVRIVIP